MSDAQALHIDDAVDTLVRLCGYTPEHALAELTAFSHREKAGLIPTERALQVLEGTAVVGDDDSIVLNRHRWREILRCSETDRYERAA
ncbi:hypothetical protein CH300_06065 [Rhodococcus sp. 15-1154-1]|nr:hypothetical protein [Rhodococcus sp. 15-1154-1]OZF07509.1 hypothetical protein CH300_06065 [Rhodococcus sp. 15-1154-1]